MNYDYNQTEFSKSLLSGIFAGISAVIISLLFNIIFRGMTGFSLSQIINVPTIIFSLLIVLTIAGLVFYLFHHYFKNGTAIFRGAGFLVTIALMVLTMFIQRSPDPVIAAEFRELLNGVIVISGLSVIWFIPYLFSHDYI